MKYDFDIALYNINGKRIKQSKINKGQTIAYFDIETVYAGIYLVKISNENNVKTFKVVIKK